MNDFDVAIIGGGPAGTAAALTLLRYSKLRPVVIELSNYEQWRVGETLAPGVFPLLEYLGASEIVVEQAQQRAYGTSAAWGSNDVVSRDFLFVGAGDAWHLDRVRFDAALARLVASRGGTVITNAFVERETRNGETWTLALNDGRALTAKFVIDASGRHSAFARRQGARVDATDTLTGIVGIFDAAGEGDSSTLVEAAPHGWWYSARLPEGKLVVAFMSDVDIVRAHQLHDRDKWTLLLAQTAATRARIASASLTRDPVTCPAHSQIVAPVAGEGWLAAGDAALGFDPLSSMGIGYALASGIQAARVAANPTPVKLEAYAADVQRHYDSYLSRKRAYYALEQRWPDSVFWARRR
ncbi:MAG TPA: tryptophan 7-halogenase [Thermoanaerobaculia bacterium]|nr:tryptophan 7-halogenase [Thermoanaerobaculia bacterium]